jgi:YD repeat-containing protein
MRSVPLYAGANPELYPIRVRKLAAKNLLLLHYPLAPSSDPSSAVAFAGSSAREIDRMGPGIGGATGAAHSVADEQPCVTIVQGPGRQQSWRLDCLQEPPADTRLEMFATYPGLPLFTQSRADFSFGGRPEFAFIRKYKTGSDVRGPFGVGAAHSYELLPVGDSATFSTMELVMPDGRRVHYDRTSKGTGWTDAKFRARAYMGDPFSQSTMAWNTGGWDITTRDHWTYRFPSSGPGRTWPQSALIGISSASGQAFAMRRGDQGDLAEVRAPDGGTLVFTYDAMHRITSAAENGGRRLGYDYNAAGLLAHVGDEKNGDRYYEYDPANRLTAVIDADHRPLLINRYDAQGEIVSQTLADGGQLRYRLGYYENHQLGSLSLTLPNGYVLEWQRTREGLTLSWPKSPARRTP